MKSRNPILLLILPLMIAVSACSMVEQPETPCPVQRGDDNIHLDFRMISSNITRATRTDDMNHEEVDSDWQTFEDAISENDFAFFIFLGNSADAPLLMKVTNIFNSADPDMMITGSLGSYTISFTIPKKDLEDKLGRELDSNSLQAIEFRIVVLANCYSPGTGGDYASLNAATYSDLIDQTSGWSFNMGEIYSPSESGSFTVDGLYKGFIPMYGTRLFSTTEKDLYDSRQDSRIWLGDMFLLRALAKIRVIDAITKNAGSIYPRISKAEIVSSTVTARQLPYDAINYKDGYQVHSPNIVTTVEEGKMNFLLGAHPDDKGGSLMWGYIPEQTISLAEPEYVVTIDFSETSHETYRIPMKGYKNQTFDFGNNILRNHIYTLQINSVKTGVPADITVSVKDWEPFSLDLDYNDQVTVLQPIDWNQESIFHDDSDEGYVVMQPWHDGKSPEAECSFTIGSPIGVTWTAYLITTEGAQGSFRFVDAEGKEVDSISGVIDGNASKLKIVTTNSDPEQNNSAILQVVVSLAGMKYMEANICGNKSYKNYRIIQNKQ